MLEFFGSPRTASSILYPCLVRAGVHTWQTYSGAGSPSASHSMMNGLSFSSARDFTWKSNSSVGGCFTIRGGLWTGRKEEKLQAFFPSSLVRGVHDQVLSQSWKEQKTMGWVRYMLMRVCACGWVGGVSAGPSSTSYKPDPCVEKLDPTGKRQKRAQSQPAQEENCD